MGPQVVLRRVHELEVRTRRMHRLLERLAAELEHAADEVSRVRHCLLSAPCSPDGAVRHVRGRHAGSLERAPRTLVCVQLIRKPHGGATLVLDEEAPGETRRIQLSASAADLLRALMPDPSGPTSDDRVTIKPNSELRQRLRTRSGASLSYGALRQRVSVLRRHLVDQGGLHPDVLVDARMNGESGYALAWEWKPRHGRP